MFTVTTTADAGPGSLIAVEVGTNLRILDRELNPVQLLLSLNGGVAFDPLQDVLYAARSGSGLIYVYDTNTWTELYTLTTGDFFMFSEPFATGEMTITEDGTLLFLSTQAGIRVVHLTGGGPGPAPGGGFDTGVVAWFVAARRREANLAFGVAGTSKETVPYA